MSKTDSFSVKNVPELDARVLELPYKGGDYSLFIILPNTKTGLTAMENKLTGQVSGYICKNMCVWVEMLFTQESFVFIVFLCKVRHTGPESNKSMYLYLRTFCSVRPS